MSAESMWRRCSTCKKPITFASGYYACSVSTCNRRAASFVFCSVPCWDAHVPVMRHRDAGAVEETAPTAAEWARQQEGEHAPRADAAHEAARATPRDVLVVVSKLKLYVRETTGMSTSDDVIALLSDRLRELCDAAAQQARAAGRKTVMARDFGRSRSDV